MARIKRSDIDSQIKRQVHIWGYERFHIEHRYDYYAIDEMELPHKVKQPSGKIIEVQDCIRTYKAAIPLKEAFNLVEALIDGAGTILDMSDHAAINDLVKTAKAVMRWAQEPIDHGGNPYMKNFVRLAETALGRINHG